MRSPTTDRGVRVTQHAGVAGASPVSRTQGREYDVYSPIPKVTRGVRGATTLTEDTREQIMDATEELLAAMIKANNINSEDIAAVYFTVTQDIHAEFPAAAARERLHWRLVPLINSVEIEVHGAIEMCIRVLMFINTTKTQRDIKHIYLREAVKLRQDITDAQ